LSSTRQANHHCVKPADGGAGQHLNRLFERHTLYRALGFDTPALIPQVYLHYDPYTRRASMPLTRQRMDFLLLLPHRRRVVIELDGVHHYADDQQRADLRRYAQMVAEDRALQLAGYEVYRFGGHELANRQQAAKLLDDFFTRLLEVAHTRLATLEVSGQISLDRRPVSAQV
jgi:very-short-patch-repair endonuclease